MHQHELRDMHEAAVREAKQGDFGHGFLHAAAGRDSRGMNAFRHKLSARRAGEAQCLGECLEIAGRLL
jgi:hypothetical protein